MDLTVKTIFAPRSGITYGCHYKCMHSAAAPFVVALSSYKHAAPPEQKGQVQTRNTSVAGTLRCLSYN